MAAPLFHDDFSDGNYTANPVWSVNAGNWSVVGGAVVSGGLVSNDYLRTGDFTAITNGVFSLSVDVRFSSADVTGNNRFYLRMRDSTASYAGYEVAIAQGTMANTTFNLLGSATMGTQTKTSSPQVFPTTGHVNITWTRDSSGLMTVYVNGSEYLSVSSSSISRFDVIEIGGRGWISESVSYTYAFDNVTLGSIPEPKTAALLFGGIGLAAACVCRQRR